MAGRLSDIGAKAVAAAARRGAAGSAPASGARGFTLIELMVVVTIVSVLSIGAALSVGGAGRLLQAGGQAGPAAQGERLARALERGRDAALFGRRRAGLQPLGGGWQLRLLDAVADRWGTLQSAEMPGIEITWTVAGQSYAPPDAAPEGAPPIRILADGRLTPFSLRLRGGGQGLTCRATDMADVTCTAF